MNADAKPSLLTKIFPFLVWLPELKSGETLRVDFLAGLTIALVLIPQSMAYAQLAGLPPYFGLYAAFLPPIVAALFGSSRQLATGPVAVVSLMTAAALQPLAATGSEGYIAYAILLALLVGIFQLFLGFARLGVLVSFLSHPVVVGFTNAAAIIIATSQLDKIFGVTAEKADHHYETVWNIVRAVAEGFHWPTFLMAVLAFGVMILMKRFTPKVPGVLLAVVLTTLIAYYTQYEQKQVATIDSIASPSVRGLLTSQLQLEQQLKDMGQKVAKSQKAYIASKNAAGPKAEQTMQARFNLDKLKAQEKEITAQLATGYKELKYLRLSYVASSAASGRFYSQDQVPDGSEVQGDDWRVASIGEQGELAMRAGGKVVGSIPQALPSMKIPSLDWQVIIELFPIAITISLIGFMEAISIAKAMAARTRQRLDANQELIGQGLSNVVGSLFQSYAVSGSFSRSAVNIGAGARTGFSSVVTGLMVGGTLLWLTPLLYHLPQATLAAVIMMAVIGLVNVKPIIHAWKIQPHDGIAGIVTFILTLAFAPHLDKGIIFGVALSLALYLYRTMSPRVAVLGRYTDGTLRDMEALNLATCEYISIIRFDGSLYFANINFFENKLLERIADKPKLKFVIVVAEGINQIDASGEEALHGVVQRLHDMGIQVYFSRGKKQIIDTLKRSGFVDFVGKDHFFRHTQFAIERAWSQLEENHGEHCPLKEVVGAPTNEYGDDLPEKSAT